MAQVNGEVTVKVDLDAATGGLRRQLGTAGNSFASNLTKSLSGANRAIANSIQKSVSDGARAGANDIQQQLTGRTFTAKVRLEVDNSIRNLDRDLTRRATQSARINRALAGTRQEVPVQIEASRAQAQAAISRATSGAEADVRLDFDKGFRSFNSGLDGLNSRIKQSVGGGFTQTFGRAGRGFSGLLKQFSSQVIFESILGEAARAAIIGLGTAFASGAQSLDIPRTLANQFQLSLPEATAAGKVAGELFQSGFGEDLGAVTQAVGRFTELAGLDVVQSGGFNDFANFIGRAGGDLTQFSGLFNELVDSGQTADEAFGSIASAVNELGVDAVSGADGVSELNEALAEAGATLDSTAGSTLLASGSFKTLTEAATGFGRQFQLAVSSIGTPFEGDFFSFTDAFAAQFDTLVASGEVIGLRLRGALVDQFGQDFAADLAGGLGDGILGAFEGITNFITDIPAIQDAFDLSQFGADISDFTGSLSELTGFQFPTSLSEGLIDVGNALTAFSESEITGGFLDGLVGVLQAAAPVARELASALQEIGFDNIASGIAPAVAGLTLFNGLSGPLVGIVSGLGSALGGLGGGATVAGLGLGSIAGLAGGAAIGIGLLAASTEEGRQAFQNIGDAVGPQVQTDFSNFVTGLQEISTAVVSFADESGIADFAITGFTSQLADGVQDIAAFADAVGDLAGVFQAIGSSDFLQDVFGQLGDGTLGQVADAVAEFQGIEDGFGLSDIFDLAQPIPIDNIQEAVESAKELAGIQDQIGSAAVGPTSATLEDFGVALSQIEPAGESAISTLIRLNEEALDPALAQAAEEATAVAGASLEAATAYDKLTQSQIAAGQAAADLDLDTDFFEGLAEATAAFAQADAGSFAGLANTFGSEISNAVSEISGADLGQIQLDLDPEINVGEISDNIFGQLDQLQAVGAKDLKVLINALPEVSNTDLVLAGITNAIPDTIEKDVVLSANVTSSVNFGAGIGGSIADGVDTSFDVPITINPIPTINNAALGGALGAIGAAIPDTAPTENVTVPINPLPLINAAALGGALGAIGAAIPSTAPTKTVTVPVNPVPLINSVALGGALGAIGAAIPSTAPTKTVTVPINPVPLINSAALGGALGAIGAAIPGTAPTKTVTVPINPVPLINNAALGGIIGAIGASVPSTAPTKTVTQPIQPVYTIAGGIAAAALIGAAISAAVPATLPPKNVSQPVNVTYNVTDNRAALEAVRGAVLSLNGLSANISVTQTGAQAAQSAVQGLSGAVAALSGKNVSVTQTGAEGSAGAVRALSGAINALSGKVVNVSANVSGEGAVRGLAGAIAGVSSKTVTITARTVGGRFLADGDIIRRPTAAIIGEAGPEAVIPLSRPARALQLLQQSGLDQLLFNAFATGQTSRVSSRGGGSGTRGLAAGSRVQNTDNSTVTNNFVIETRDGQNNELIGRSLARELGAIR